MHSKNKRTHVFTECCVVFVFVFERRGRQGVDGVGGRRAVKREKEEKKQKQKQQHTRSVSGRGRSKRRRREKKKAKKCLL